MPLPVSRVYLVDHRWLYHNSLLQALPPALKTLCITQYKLPCDLHQKLQNVVLDGWNRRRRRID